MGSRPRSFLALYGTVLGFDLPQGLRRAAACPENGAKRSEKGFSVTSDQPSIGVVM